MREQETEPLYFPVTEVFFPSMQILWGHTIVREFFGFLKLEKESHCIHWEGLQRYRRIHYFSRYKFAKTFSSDTHSSMRSQAKYDKGYRWHKNRRLTNDFVIAQQETCKSDRDWRHHNKNSKRIHIRLSGCSTAIWTLSAAQFCSPRPDARRSYRDTHDDIVKSRHEGCRLNLDIWRRHAWHIKDICGDTTFLCFRLLTRIRFLFKRKQREYLSRIQSAFRNLIPLHPILFYKCTLVSITPLLHNL